MAHDLPESQAAGDRWRANAAAPQLVGISDDDTSQWGCVRRRLFATKGEELAMSSVKNKAAKKYDRAVANARGDEGTELAPTEAELAISESPDAELAGALTTMSQEEVMREISSGDVEAAPMLVSLKIGQTLYGKLEGNGPDAELTDKDTGEVTRVKTWIISLAGGAMRVSILDTVQLAKKLPPFLKDPWVKIHRGADKRSGTRIYTDYLVWGPKGAKPRDWSGGAAPVDRQLPANTEHEELLEETVSR